MSSRPVLLAGWSPATSSSDASGSTSPLGTRTPGEADDAAETVANGEMPPRRYVLVHPDAALNASERQVLVEALEAMERDRGGGDRSGPGGNG
jgi:Haem-binding domain